MLSLLALARAEFEEVTRLNRTRLGSHILTLFLGLAALMAPEPWAYGCSIAAVLSEIMAWILRTRATKRQGHAAEALRRAVLMDAFGETGEPLDVADLRQGFSKRTEKRAQTLDVANYYASVAPKGRDRLFAHLQESAFWSKHLYRVASDRGLLVWVLVMAAVLLVAVFLRPFFSPSSSLNFARSAALFLSFVSTADGISRALEWKRASEQAEVVDRRLENLRTTDEEPVLAVFADYGVIAVSAPPIPPSIYKSEKERMNLLWRERKGTSKPHGD